MDRLLAGARLLIGDWKVRGWENEEGGRIERKGAKAGRRIERLLVGERLLIKSWKVRG